MFLQPLFKKPRIFFLHVPKTGRTSINSAIQKHYGRHSYHIDPIQTRAMTKLIYKPVPCVDKRAHLLRDSFILDAMNRNVPYISGHIHFNRVIWEHYSNKYAYVTLLRNPVKRYISAYFFDSAKGSGGSYTDLCLRDFVNTARGVRLGHFYLNYFSGFPVKKDYAFDDLESRIEVAKQNLSQLNLVGFLEDIEDFKVNFKEKFGLTLKIPHKNKSPVAKPQIDQDFLEEIQRICEPDIKIYAYARSCLLNKASSDQTIVASE